MDVACERSHPPPIPARFRTSDPVHGDGAPATSPIDDPDSKNGVYGPHYLVHSPRYRHHGGGPDNRREREPSATSGGRVCPSKGSAQAPDDISGSPTIQRRSISRLRVL